MAPTDVQLPPKNLNIMPMRAGDDTTTKLNEMIQRYDEIYRVLREYVENGLSDVNVLTNVDFRLEVALGNVPGNFAVNKFGSSSNIDTTPTDIWDHATQNIWLPPTQARVHTISSTSADDTAGGAGARTIRIWGLTDWDTAETFEDVTLNTGSPPTTRAYVIIHRMRVLTTGSTGPFSNVGIISAVAAVDGTTTAQIFTIKGQTQMAILGVPSTQRFFMYGLHGSIAKDSPGLTPKAGAIVLTTVDVENNPFAYIFKHTWTLQGDGLTSSTVPFVPPKNEFDGPCIIKIAMVADTNDSLGDASFDGILVDN